MTRPKFTISRRRPPAPSPQVSPQMGLPPVSSVCHRCGAYVIHAEKHSDWHRVEDAKASRWEQFRTLVLDVFQARGYITKGGNTTPTDGGTR